jgi:hypothetical protein
MTLDDAACVIGLAVWASQLQHLKACVDRRAGPFLSISNEAAVLGGRYEGVLCMYSLAVCFDIGCFQALQRSCTDLVESKSAGTIFCMSMSATRILSAWSLCADNCLRGCWSAAQPDLTADAGTVV